MSNSLPSTERCNQQKQKNVCSSFNLDNNNKFNEEDYIRIIKNKNQNKNENENENENKNSYRNSNEDLNTNLNKNLKNSKIPEMDLFKNDEFDLIDYNTINESRKNP